MRSNHFVKSPLRYPGGKSRALSQIVPLIPEFKEYREPMVGGGSVFFNLKQAYPTSIPSCESERIYWINDINYELYCFWKMAQECAHALAEAVRVIKEQTVDGKQLFYDLLSQYGQGTEFERAVRFFVLNRITFSGTVDSGGYSEHAFKGRFTHSAINSLEQLPAILQGTQITHLDYQEVVCAPGKDVFLFLDPPYYSVAKSRLYGKRGELHLQFDHERLARALKSCPHRWLLTYDDCEEVRRLYRDAYTVEWTLQYGMNNYKQSSARPGKELFIANYDIGSLHHRQLALILEKKAGYDG